MRCREVSFAVSTLSNSEVSLDANVEKSSVLIVICPRLDRLRRTRRLATDLTWIGKGIGTGLLKQALQRCVTAAKLIGGRALIVNAVDAEAAAFWGRRGFIPSKDDPLILFRSIADIAASLR